MAEPVMVQMSKSDVAVSKTFSAKFWVILLMTICGCYMSIKRIEIDAQFATLWGVVVTSYFAKTENQLMAKKPEEKDAPQTTL